MDEKNNENEFMLFFSKSFSDEKQYEDMKQSARVFKAYYDSFIEAGFSRQEALKIVLECISAAIQSALQQRGK